jgi:hypothetical protein
MNRNLTYLFGPELVLALFSAAIFWFCARHNSGEGRDIAVLEKLVMTFPLYVVPLVFLTICVPGARNWVWLTRSIVFTYTMLAICGGRIVSGFGTGAKGQDVAFIMVIGLGTILIALGTSITGAMILANVKPTFGAWFGARKFLGSTLTLLAAVPIGFALGIFVTVLIGILASAYAAIKG